MRPSDIENTLAMTPFKPLRITLGGGDKILIDRPFRTTVEGGNLWISGSMFAS